jgi:probable F420-dependent oxidoreductase
VRFGYLSLNNAEGIRPARLARELEDRGFDSVWMPEHSHIPVSRDTPYPAGGDLPDGYWHMMDPFVSLQAAAAVTTKLILATGICLVLEHDILDLACTVATLDVLSGGRALLGIGVGWNREELVNHRPELPFKLRYSAMRERVDALRRIWTEEEPAYDGRFERFSASWVYPKPIQQPVPIALGNAGKVGIQHAAEYADHWCPIDAQLLNYDGKPDVRGGIELFRRLAAEAGRPAEDIPISVFAFGPPNRKRLDVYEELNVERIVVPPPTMMRHDEAATLGWLDQWAPVLEQMK